MEAPDAEIEMVGDLDADMDEDSVQPQAYTGWEDELKAAPMENWSSSQLSAFIRRMAPSGGTKAQSEVRQLADGMRMTSGDAHSYFATLRVSLSSRMWEARWCWPWDPNRFARQVFIDRAITPPLRR